MANCCLRNAPMASAAASAAAIVVKCGMFMVTAVRRIEYESRRALRPSGVLTSMATSPFFIRSTIWGRNPSVTLYTLSTRTPARWITSAVPSVAMSRKPNAAKRVANKTWKPQEIYWGFRENLIGLSSFHPSVPKPVQQKVVAELKKMKEGKDDSFLGPIKDQEGTVAIAAGQRASDQTLLTMKWFVEGVVGKIPE